MMIIRKARDRLHSNLGWLESWHTFSFGDHHDPHFMGFRDLRVINDDTVAKGGGFPTHGHRDMEIISYVLDGALGHKDSMGTGSVIRPGDVQGMTAGTGVRHSEMNASDGPTHFLQIWILPDRRNHQPSYAQRHFPREARHNQLCLIASRDGREGSISLHASTDIYTTLLDGSGKVDHAMAPGRHAWLHVARGAVRLNGEALQGGDGAAISDESLVTLESGAERGEVLLFDLS